MKRPKCVPFLDGGRFPAVAEPPPTLHNRSVVLQVSTLIPHLCGMAMNHPIAGAAPRELDEVTSMITWPGIGAYGLGRLVGRLAGIQIGLGRFLTLGKMLALATIPLSLGTYLWKVLPFVHRRYRITDRRIVVDKGLSNVEDRWIALDQFDAIDVLVLPGQDWLRAGDVVFRRDGVEVFRLCGVLRPIAFREVCLKARTALVAVREVLQQQQAVGHQ
jgi:hypothetical protein